MLSRPNKSASPLNRQKHNAWKLSYLGPNNSLLLKQKHSASLLKKQKRNDLLKAQQEHRR